MSFGLHRLRSSAVSLLWFVMLVRCPKANPQGSQPAHSGRPGGVYALENALDFNSLDGAFFDSQSGRITLFGHHDPRYRGAIPYLQHLSVLLEQPRPAFSLEWTPETRTRVDHFTHSTDWARIFEGQERVSRIGAYLLQSVGVYPTRNKNAPGFLGLRMEAGPDPGTIRIAAVDQGSPAALAGMKSGEIVKSVPEAPLLDPAVVEHSMRFSGAGSSFSVCVQGKQDCYKPVLAAAGGDPWAYMGQDDVAAGILRAAGNQNAALAADALAVWHRASDNQAGVRGMYQVFGDTAEREKTEADIAAGKLDPMAGAQRMLRRLCERMDEAFATHGAIIRAFEARLARENNPGPALAACLNGAGPAMLELESAMMAQLTAKPGGIPIPPDLAEAVSGFHFESVPKFIRLNSNSLLARVMEESDYQAKSIIEREDLSKKFPRYQTEQAYEATHPEAARANGLARVWITPHYVDAAQSPDGSTLLIRGMKMRFNIRGVGANGKDLSPLRGGYQDLLTSLYDDFAAEYPVLHELEEASRLSLVAEWIHSHNAAFRLPAEGRISWTTPQKLPGIVFIYLSVKTKGGASMIENRIIRPSGGVALSPFPQGNSDMRLQDMVGTDPSIQAFPAHGASTASAPGGIDPTLFYSGIRQPLPVRPPQAAAWAGHAIVDGRQVNIISVGDTRDVRATTPQSSDQKAFALWKAGDLSGAEQKYRELLQNARDPRERAGLKMLLFGVLEERGDRNGALAEAAEAHRLAPDYLPAYLIYIKALSDSGDARGATAEMTKYLVLDPDNQPARGILTNLRERQNQQSVLPFPAPGMEFPNQLFGAPEANSAMARAQFDALQRTYLNPVQLSQRIEVERQIRRQIEIKQQIRSATAGMSPSQATKWLENRKQELQTKSDNLKQRVESLPPGPQKDTLQTEQQKVQEEKKATEDISVEWNEEKPASQSPTPTPRLGL